VLLYFFLLAGKKSVSVSFRNFKNKRRTQYHNIYICDIYYARKLLEIYSKTSHISLSLSLSGYARIRHLSPFPLDGALAKMCLKIGTPARRTEDRMRSNSGFASAHGPSIFIFNVRLANANESGVNVKKSPIVIPYAIIKLRLIISSIHAAIPCAENAVANEKRVFVRNCLRNGMDIVNAPTANNAHANASKTVSNRLAIKLELKIADTKLTPSKALPKLVLSAR